MGLGTSVAAHKGIMPTLPAACCFLPINRSCSRHPFASAHRLTLHFHRIHAVTALWSSKPGQEKAPLTVVTAVTKDRVDNLRAQCAAWPGPLVAVFYTGLSPKEWEQFRARLGANKQSGGRKAAEEGLGSLFNIGLGQEAGQVNATAAGSEQQAGKGSGGGLDAGQAERMAEEEAALGTARKLLLVHSNKAAGAASQQQAARPAHRLDDALVATRELFAW